MPNEELQLLADSLAECVDKPQSLQSRIESIISKELAEGADAESLKDRLVEILASLRVDEMVARSYVCLAFKRQGIRFRDEGGGRKRQALSIKGRTISCFSAIRFLEKEFGVTTDSERQYLSRFLLTVSREISKRQK